MIFNKTSNDERELERQRELQRVTNSYHRIFKTADGALVLKNLRAYFRMDRPAFERAPMNCSYDPIAAALRDGQREVLLFIEHKLAQPMDGDADATQPKNKIIT